MPHPDLGIVELVRNSYDADATICEVELKDARAPGGSVVVNDNGTGMGLREIQDGWLVLGRSQKRSTDRTPGRKRLPVGQKGLGRLASLRLGTFAELATRPEAEPGVEYRLLIDWSAFETVQVVEDVELQVTRHATTQGSGTTVTILDLRQPLTDTDVGRLARALLVLADPFGDPPGTKLKGVKERLPNRAKGFCVRFQASEFAELERLVSSGFLSLANYSLSATLDEGGQASMRIWDRRGKLIHTADHKTIRAADWARRGNRKQVTDDFAEGRYSAPEASFEFWTFLLNQDFQRGEVAKGDVREWIRRVGGVYVYHRGLRVFPYGDAGHDWLELNLARARSPEERPSTNNSVGRVTVEDPQDVLKEKTDRTGFVASDAFDDLRAWAQACLQVLATVRLTRREDRKVQARAEAPRRRAEAREQLRETFSSAPPPLRRELSKGLESLEKAFEGQLATVRRDLELYRTLATVGTTVAVFAHETEKPVSRIAIQSGVLNKLLKRLLSTTDYTGVQRHIDEIRAGAILLSGFAKIPVELLGKQRRSSGEIDVNKIVQRVLTLFETFILRADVHVEQGLEASLPKVRSTEAAIEAIVANLVTNAIAALTDGSGAPSGERKLRVETSRLEEKVALVVADNGPGIRGLSLDRIWLPGETTRDKGNGLGLTIVRDAATAMGGTVSALAKGRLGGAEFTIVLPTGGT